MGNDLSERKLEVSKGTPRVVDSGVKIEDVNRAVRGAALIQRNRCGRRRRLLEAYHASCSFCTSDVTGRIATASSTSSSSKVTKGTNDRIKGGLGVSGTGGAATERALEAEVAVTAGPDVEGYRTYEDGLGRVADGLKIEAVAAM